MVTSMGVARIFQRGGHTDSYARIFQRGGHTDSYIGYSPNCHLNIVGCLLTKRLTKEGSRAPQDPPPPGYALDYKKIPNDDHTKKVSFVSLLLFQWMNSVFKTGSERALDENDFLSEENTTSSVTERLQTKWNDEITNFKEKEKKP